MGQNIVEKILSNHIIEGNAEKGKEIGIRIDQTLTQDATGTMVYLQLEAIGIDKIKTELSVSYIDHNTLQDGFENMDDHRYLRTVANRFGIVYSKAGNGICHQLHVERFGIPGKTLLGSDSHTPTCGGIGMIAIGAGGLDVASAIAGGAFYVTYPKVIQVILTGKLQPFVSAKDVILKLLEILTTKGNVGYIVEYSGDGVKTLSVPERATITNMGAELGVTTSIFPSDEVTKQFMKAQNREKDWILLKADPDAVYDKTIEIDLNTLEPMVACPHSPDNIKKVKDIAGLKVDQVLVGSCTNGSFRDLMTVSQMLKNQKVKADVSFGVAPGSRQVLEMISENGALADIVKSGARILETACGFCIGAGQSPNSEGISVRTNNRNFKGRSGTDDAGIYLVSPETAVACAITGKMTDPREIGLKKPNIKIPSKFYLDDSEFIFSQGDKNTEILRGPNIGNPPSNDILPENLNASVSIKVGDKITTDHIMPAGNRLKYRSNIEKYATFVFEGVDPEFSNRAKINKSKGIHNIIVGGLSYGQGSSREHAAMCPMFLGVKMVISKSFERIHTDNLINFGIIPAIFKNESDYDKISFEDHLSVENIRKSIEKDSVLKVKNVTKNFEFEISIHLSERQRQMILNGGKLNFIKNSMK